MKTATSITVVQEIVWNAVASGWLPTSVDPQVKPTRVPNFPNGPSTEEMSAVLVAHAELHHPEVCVHTLFLTVTVLALALEGRNLFPQQGMVSDIHTALPPTISAC